LQAFIAGLLLHIDHFVTPEAAPWLFMNLYRALIINCALAALNLLPILPLDGGRVVDSLLSGTPKRLYDKLERYGIVIVMIVLVGLPMLGIHAAQLLVSTPAYWLLDHILWLTGNGAINPSS
jgi:Zn-dependent protease